MKRGKYSSGCFQSELRGEIRPVRVFTQSTMRRCHRIDVTRWRANTNRNFPDLTVLLVFLGDTMAKFESRTEIRANAVATREKCVPTQFSPRVDKVAIQRCANRGTLPRTLPPHMWHNTALRIDVVLAHGSCVGMRTLCGIPGLRRPCLKPNK